MMPGAASGLEDVLSGWRADAAALRRHGCADVADALDRRAAEVESAAADYLTWISEDDAKLRSGHSAEWFKGRFAEWEPSGHAKTVGKVRLYRQLVVPQRRNIHMLREGQRTGREAA